MDIVSHALWAGAAGALLRRRYGSSRAMVAAAVAMGAAPDLISLAPVIAWSASQPAPLALLYGYIAATPGTEPALPPLVGAMTHHLHCVMHSAVIAATIGLLAWWKRPALLVALAGWWLHIALDIPTHSSDYYAVPFLYPFTYWGVDGIPWTTPWLLAVNYAAIAATYGTLFALRQRARPKRIA